MATHPSRPLLPGTWSSSARRSARLLARPVQAFLAVEAAGGVLLVGAAVIGLAWANSPWREGYHTLFHTEVALQVGAHEIRETLAHWIDDALMAVFFFVVGLEIKQEWVSGELRDRRAAALPAVAAVGGMVVPALLYAAINRGGPGGHGWGIPMATDIAFAMGVLALLGSRVPSSLKVFLLTLAIVDDIGAIVVIALAYSGSLSWSWLGLGAVVVAVAAGMRRLRVVYGPLYVVLGLALWFCVYRSGVHATLAGVVFALLIPARPLLSEGAADEIVDTLEGRAELHADEVRRVSFLVRESAPLTERLIDALHPWTSYVVVPVFALAASGVELSRQAVSTAGATTAGVMVGLVVGKVVGITAFSALAVRTGVGVLPDGVRWPQLAGVGLVAGIGFTVSLFIAGLAFTDPAIVDHAKLGVLAASVVAAVAGSAVLHATGSGEPEPEPDGSP